MEKINAPGGSAQKIVIASNDTAINPPTPPKSKRDQRCLAALANAPNGVMRYDMDRIIGTTNAPEYISRLRDMGWKIITERVRQIDRDGCECRVGRYYLMPEHRDLAGGCVGGVNDKEGAAKAK